MRTVTIASGKGGTGKTTIAAALAVRAARDFGHVGIFDLDGGQSNLAQWWSLRGGPDNPCSYEVENLREDIAALRDDGCDWLIAPTYRQVTALALRLRDASLATGGGVTLLSCH